MRLGAAYIPRGWLRDMDLMVAYAPRPIDYSREGGAFLAGSVSIVPPLECAIRNNGPRSLACLFGSIYGATLQHRKPFV